MIKSRKKVLIICSSLSLSLLILVPTFMSSTKNKFPTPNVTYSNLSPNPIYMEDKNSTSNIASKDNNTTHSHANLPLVNKSNNLDENFVPKDLVLPNIKFISYADNNVKKLTKIAADALTKLFDAAKKDNIHLIAVSGYRSFTCQSNLYNNKISRSSKEEADKYVARPGASEHQSGLAVDVVCTEYTSLEEGFENTDAYKWIKQNAYKFGYIIRYPKGKEAITGYNFEPWHLRYVGTSCAEEMMKTNSTLEEHLEKFKN